MKITLLHSITRSNPVLDKNGDPVPAKVKFFGREQEIELHDHVFCPAGTVINVDKAEADDLMKAGHARKFDEEIDAGLKGADGEETDDPSDDPDDIATSQRAHSGTVAKGRGKGRRNAELD